MSFDGNIVKHLTEEWNHELITGRITKIYQISKYDLLFIIASKSQKHQFLISSSPSYARAYLTKMTYEKPDHPPTFCMFLRKQLEGGIILNIRQVQNDRIIIFDIQKRNEIGDLSVKHLILEMMGRYSNIIVTDDQYKILEAIKHNMPFEGNERTIFPGAMYQEPESDKINPYNKEQLQSFLQSHQSIDLSTILDHIMGFSPFIAREIIHRHTELGISYTNIFESILYDTKPQLIKSKKDVYYATDILHVTGDVQYFDSVNETLDYYYYERDQIDVIKQHSKEVTTFVKNYVQRLNNKIDKLSHELEQTSKMDRYRIEGELIQQNLQRIERGDTEVDCFNYYDNTTWKIMLDPLLTPIQNSKKRFKKYKKLKTSIPYIHDQIEQAKLELQYFYEIESQFEYATLKDISEIKEELQSKKYLKQKTTQKRKKKPNIDTYYDDLGIPIIVGKNNTQNEYITHQLAHHTDVWFHVKNAPGSHVLVKAPLPLEETTIRSAAQLAAYHSSMRHSSSVPVDYVERRYLKKVPKMVSSFVTYRNQKTIYIDPDEAFIKSMKKV